MRSRVAYRISLALLAVSLVALLSGGSEFQNLRLYFAKAFNRSLSYQAGKHEKLRLRAFPGQSVSWNAEVASSLQNQWSSSQGLTLLLMNPNTAFQSAYHIAGREQTWSTQISPVDTTASPTSPVTLSGLIQIPPELAAQRLEGRLVGSIAYPVPAVPPPSYLTTDRAVTIYEDLKIPAGLEVIPYDQSGAARLVAGLAGLLGTLIFGVAVISSIVRRNFVRWRVTLAEKAIVTFVKAVAPLTQANPKLARKKLAEGTLKTSFEHEVPAPPKSPAVPDVRDNLVRLRYSGLLESWVRENKGIWSHREWLDLLETLKRSEYWPVEANAVGSMLEQIKKDFDEMPHAAFPVEQPVAADSIMAQSAFA